MMGWHAVQRRLRMAMAATAFVVATGALGQVPDPVVSDPAASDPQFPARLSSVTIRSGEAVLNGRALIAQGKGPHPTILLLHGFPGNELNLDVAQAARRAGWNVFTFHYRGSWGSGGDFSFEHVLADTTAALAYLRGLAADPAWRVDGKHIVLVGHSLGGFAALMAGAADPDVKSIASISGFDLGKAGQIVATRPEVRDFWLRLLRNTASLKVPDPQAVIDEWVHTSADWSFDKLAPRLKDKHVLLVAASKDTVAPAPLHHQPLASALKASLGPSFKEVTLETDHSYSDRRIALMRAVVEWLEAQR